MPNTVQRMLKQARDAVPGQRPVRLPGQQPTLGERAAGAPDALAAAAGYRAQATPSRLAGPLTGIRERLQARAGRQQPAALGDEVGPVSEEGVPNAGNVTSAAAQAAVSAERAERASARAAAAASEIVAALNRIVSIQPRSVAQGTGTEEGPTDVEIRLGEAAESPLMRAADAVARLVTAAGETLYDYSGGQYGLPPVDASDLRREREKERERARPVTIIERHEEDASRKQRRRARPLVIAGVLVVAAVLGLAYWQRRRVQALIARPGGVQAGQTGGPLSPTPSFERVIRGELIPRRSITPIASGADAPSATTGANPTPGPASSVTGTVTEGDSRTYTAGETGDAASPPA